jgi:uracil-DNA glycosylase family 4
MNGGATGRVGAMPPDDLQVLASQVRTCTRCRLAETRTFAVPGSGDPDAPLMLVAEAPGAKEDATGLPFQGHGRPLPQPLPGRSRGRPRAAVHHLDQQVPPARQPRAEAR